MAIQSGDDRQRKAVMAKLNKDIILNPDLSIEIEPQGISAKIKPSPHNKFEFKTTLNYTGDVGAEASYNIDKNKKLTVQINRDEKNIFFERKPFSIGLKKRKQTIYS